MFQAVNVTSSKCHSTKMNMQTLKKNFTFLKKNRNYAIKESEFKSELSQQRQMI